MIKKSALDKLFVNCNRIEEGKAKRILSSKGCKDLSLKNYEWDIPVDLIKLSKVDCNRFETFIGIGRWNGGKNHSTKFVCITRRGEVIYLEPEIVKIIYNSIMDGKK